MNMSTMKLKSTGKQIKMNQQHPKPMGQVKAVLREKFTVLQAYLKKIEKSQINNLTLQLK